MHVSEDGVAVCKKDVQEATGDDVVTCDRSTVTVTGRVTLAGQPGGGHLSWDAKVNSRYGRSVTTSYSGSLRRTVVVLPAGSQHLKSPLDSEGNYRLEAVLPGEWKVNWSLPEGGHQESREVTVPDGPGEFTLNFDYGGVSIEGVVTDPEGQAVHLAGVDIFPQALGSRLGSGWPLPGPGAGAGRVPVAGAVTPPAVRPRRRRAAGLQRPSDGAAPAQ